MNRTSRLLAAAGIAVLMIGFVSAHGVTKYPNYTSYQVGPGSNGYCYFGYDAAGDTVREYCVDTSSSPINGQGYAFSWAEGSFGNSYGTSAYAYYDVDGDGPTVTTPSGYVYAHTGISFKADIATSGGSEADASLATYEAWQYLSCADYVCSYPIGDYVLSVIWDAGSDGSQVVTGNTVCGHSTCDIDYEFQVSPDSVSGIGGVSLASYGSSVCEPACNYPWGVVDLTQADGYTYTVQFIEMVAVP